MLKCWQMFWMGRVGIVEADYAQDQQVRITGAPWAYREVGGSVNRSIYFTHYTAKPRCSSRKGRGGFLTIVEWSWSLSTGWDLHFLLWYSEATLAIWSERLAKDPYEEKHLPGSVQKLTLKGCTNLLLMHIWVWKKGLHGVSSALCSRTNRRSSG